MVIPEEVAVRFATDLLASTLPTTLAEEDVLEEPPSVTNAPDLPILGSPERITMQPKSSETGALLETTTALPANPTTGLGSTGMI